VDWIGIPEVDRILGTLLDRVRQVLQDRFVGMYLYGSLSLGDFDPESSDIDFLVVTASEIPAGELDDLAAMHAELKAGGEPFADRLEGSYIPRADLRRYDPRHSDHPSIGVDWDFGIGKHGWNWVLERATVRDSGIVLAGPPPEDLIDPVRPAELKNAVRRLLQDFWEPLGEPEWLELAAYQAFAILTMCRALYTLSTGELATKPQAAHWAAAALGDPWAADIQWALAHRHDFTPHAPATAHRFIRHALDQADLG
jgi:predicted nucleotidyltransferase